MNMRRCVGALAGVDKALMQTFARFALPLKGQTESSPDPIGERQLHGPESKENRTQRKRERKHECRRLSRSNDFISRGKGEEDHVTIRSPE